MTLEDHFRDALKRLVDDYYGQADPEDMIDALEGRIGVLRARMEEDEEE